MKKQVIRFRVLMPRPLVFWLAAIVGLFMLFSVGGCVTEKACNRKFPTSDSTTIAYVTNTVYRDTTITITIPGDTVYGTVQVVTGPTGLVSSPVQVLHTTLAVSKTWVENGRLKHLLQQKDSVFNKIIEKAIKEHSSVKIVEKIKTDIQRVNYVTGWQWFQIWAGRILLVVAMVMILIGMVGNYFGKRL